MKPPDGASAPGRPASPPPSRDARCPHERPDGGGTGHAVGWAPASAQAQLLRLAMDVPASGGEADDWRTRNLAELLLQAAVTGDAVLVAHVDGAAAGIREAAPRFVRRLDALRAIAGRATRCGARTATWPADIGPAPQPQPQPQPWAIGLAVASGMGHRVGHRARHADETRPEGQPEADIGRTGLRRRVTGRTVLGRMVTGGGQAGPPTLAGYPEARAGAPPAAPAPPPEVRAAAVKMARLADRHAPRRPYVAGGRRLAGAAEVRAMLDRLAHARLGTQHRHRCVPVPVGSGLIWRGWFLDAAGPVLAFAPLPQPPAEVAMMQGFHSGVHLDHLGALVSEGRPEAARRLQFGRGLLVAESAAMAAELIGLVGGGSIDQEERAFLHASLLDRLARLPRIGEWGPRAAPGSAAMRAAAGRANHEFATLPTLAAAYVAGPFLLAERGFRHPLLPAEISRSLAGRWARVRARFR